MSNSLKDLEAMHTIVKEFKTITKSNREVLLRMLNKEHEEIGDRIDQKLSNPFSDIMDEYVKGNRYHKIPAIKAVRERAKEVGMMDKYGLREAKDLVESW